MGLPTIVCAAIAVIHLNSDVIIFRDVEQSRDNSVTAAGMILGVALVSMLIEGVITAMRLCTKGGVIGFVVSQNQSRQLDCRQKNSFVRITVFCLHCSNIYATWFLKQVNIDHFTHNYKVNVMVYIG